MKEETMAAFVTAVGRMAVGFRAGRPAGDLLTPETYRLFANTAEQLPEYSALLSQALAELPRYQPRTHKETGFELLRENECRNELRAFLLRTRFYADLWAAKTPSSRAALDGFVAAAQAAECDAVRLVPLDGLDIAGNMPISLPGGARLVKLTKADWGAFFEADLFDAPRSETLSNLWSLELRQHYPELTPNPIWIRFNPPYRVAMHLVGRWIHPINLFDEGFVRPVAVYTKLETPLALKPVEVMDVAEPLLIPRIEEDREWEEPFVSVDVQDARKFSATIADLDAGHAAASARGSRIDTALHWFTRVAEQLYGFEQGFAYGEALHEELVPDCFTILEALLLTARETGKGPKIAERAAALIAEDDSQVVALQDELRAAYALRNDLVHGDARPKARDLQKAGESLRIWVKQVMVVLLLLGGDLAQVIGGISDAGIRASNRAMVPRY